MCGPELSIVQITLPSYISGREAIQKNIQGKLGQGINWSGGSMIIHYSYVNAIAMIQGTKDFMNELINIFSQGTVCDPVLLFRIIITL